jgi:predicted house-cleaning NTP pyrophosphatase (Maf/HAM1 superfamily)
MSGMRRLVKGGMLCGKAAHKIKLDEAKVEATKVVAQATLIRAMNESAQAKVTKMKEDAKILTADTSTMEDDAKAWYKMARDSVMKEMIQEAAAEQTLPTAEQITATTPAPSSVVIDDSLASSV